MTKYKQFIKKIAYTAVSWEPILCNFRKKNKKKILVLMYHEIGSDNNSIDAWMVTKKSDFIAHMEYLRQYFKIIALDKALEGVASAGEDKPRAVITFDDGYAGNNRILLPIIKEMRLPVTIFVATSAIQNRTLYWYDRLINAVQANVPIDLDLAYTSLGRYRLNQTEGSQNWSVVQSFLNALKKIDPQKREHVVNDIIDLLPRTHETVSRNLAPLSIPELQELAACPFITIGAHSHCHNILTQLSEEAIKKSIQTSKTLLELWIRRPINYFSYPNGDYNPTVIEVLKELGFSCGLTTEPRFWDRHDSLFLIPRMGIGRYDSFDLFKARVAGALDCLRSWQRTFTSH